MKTIIKDIRLILLLLVLVSSTSSLFGQVGFTYFYSKDIKLETYSRPITETCTQVRLLVHYSGASSGTVTSSPYYLDLGETKTITVQVPGATTVTGYSWKFIMANGEYVVESAWGYGSSYGTPPSSSDWCADSLTDVIVVNLQASLTTFFLDGILGM